MIMNLNRKKITESLLHTRKYYAKEVSIDAGSIHVKRVDVMQFIPNGVFDISETDGVSESTVYVGGLNYGKTESEGLRNDSN